MNSGFIFSLNLSLLNGNVPSLEPFSLKRFKDFLPNLIYSTLEKLISPISGLRNKLDAMVSILKLGKISNDELPTLAKKNIVKNRQV